MLCNVLVAQSVKGRLPNLEGEWIATFGQDSALFSQVWDFQKDSVLVIKRGKQGKEIETYTWRIKESTFQIIENEEIILELWFHVIKENYLFLQAVINPAIILVRKSSVAPVSKDAVKNIKSLLDNRCFRLETNIDSFEWKFADIHFDATKDITFFNHQNCMLFSELNTIKNPYFNILVIRQLGEFQIQAINDSTFLSISLANAKDSIFFIEISKPDNLFDSLSFPLTLQEIKPDLLNSKRKVISVGMPKFVLNGGVTGSLRIGEDEFSVIWDYWNSNTIQINAYKKLEPIKPIKFGKLTFTSIMSSPGRRMPDHQFLLTISKSENGELILSSSNCDGTIYKIVD